MLRSASDGVSQLKLARNLGSRLTQLDEFKDLKADNAAAVSRRLIWLMAAAAVFLLALVIARLIVSWRSYGDLSSPSGVWTTQAIDLFDDGTIYRPLISNLGYGGTRYAPLHPVLQAGLMRLGMAPIFSGYLISLVASVAIIAAIYTLMRRLGISAYYAATMACFILAGNCYRQGISEIHGDPLSLALDLWGLVAVTILAKQTQRAKILTIAVAALFFVLSLATKITSIFGIITSLIWLTARGQRRQALLLCFFWIIGVCVFAFITQVASHGRAFAIFRETAAGGGGIGTLLCGPHIFFAVMLRSDHVTLGFWIVALFAFLFDRTLKGLSPILFLATTFGTMLIFGSPGTDINHLMNLQAASILLVGTSFAQFRLERFAVPAAILVLAALGIHSCWEQIQTMRRHPERLEIEAVLNDIRQSTLTGPIYANNPIIPILAGQRPYLLDTFMAHLIREKDSRNGAKLWDDLDHARFSACIIHSHPAEWGMDWVKDDAIIRAHLNKYYLKSTYGPEEVYLPKPGQH
jgi:Dolichyl-phosphate-mannose-protein mannosyltransferase